MPELPDVLVYIDALQRTVVGKSPEKIRISSPFLLRTFDPPIEAIEGRTLLAIERIGKRFVFDFGPIAPGETDEFLNNRYFVVIHLMIAGRWRWSPKPNEKPIGKVGLAAFNFENGTLHLVESSPKKRASMHIVQGRIGLKHFDRGGLDVLNCSLDEFSNRLRSENHTLKRSLTDPKLFDGIGNAYSDEILHAAQLSPVKLTKRLTDDENARLHEQAKKQLIHWTKLIGEKFTKKFPGPGDITAFRPEMAVHGKFGEPCPACGTIVQRIVYSENECNYCPRCQTGGKLLADRTMSRLLKDDWPKTIDELEDQSNGRIL